MPVRTFEKVHSHCSDAVSKFGHGPLQGVVLESSAWWCKVHQGLDSKLTADVPENWKGFIKRVFKSSSSLAMSEIPQRGYANRKLCFKDRLKEFSKT